MEDSHRAVHDDGFYDLLVTAYDATAVHLLQHQATVGQMRATSADIRGVIGRILAHIHTAMVIKSSANLIISLTLENTTTWHRADCGRRSQSIYELAFDRNQIQGCAQQKLRTPIKLHFSALRWCIPSVMNMYIQNNMMFKHDDESLYLTCADDPIVVEDSSRVEQSDALSCVEHWADDADVLGIRYIFTTTPLRSGKSCAATQSEKQSSPYTNLLTIYMHYCFDGSYSWPKDSPNAYTAFGYNNNRAARIRLGGRSDTRTYTDYLASDVPYLRRTRGHLMTLLDRKNLIS